MDLVFDIIAIIFEINFLDMGVPLTLSVKQNGVTFEYRKQQFYREKILVF